MRDFQSKSRFKRFIESKLALSLISLLFVLSLWNLLGFWGKMNETSKNRKFAEEKVSALRESKMKLESNVSKLETDRGVEEVLRENFGLSREGEEVIVIVEDENIAPVPEEKKGFMKFWQGLFD
jgi:cell division protein FtsB